VAGDRSLLLTRSSTVARRKNAAKGGVKRAGRFRLDLVDVRTLKTLVDRKMAQLVEQRAELTAQLADVEDAIAALGGPAKAPAARGKAAVVGRPRGGGRRGPRPGMTLGNVMEKILRDKGQPMQVKDIVEAVLASDYPSRSKHLRSMANQTLSSDKRFRKVGRGRYKVA
jgi:hypothetical protein